MEPTSAGDYRSKFVRTKLVENKNGAVFKIRPVSPLDYLNGAIPEGSKDGGKAFIKSILLHCVLAPKIVEKEPKDGEIGLDELAFEDYIFLSKEITEYSTSKDVNFLATGQSSSG